MINSHKKTGDKSKQYRILVVDDEESMVDVLEILLGREGYKVSCAKTGKKALSILKHEKFDLLLCDIRLGDMTGIDVLKFSKEINPEIVVIMISAYASAETAVEAMNNGAYDYVPKPFDNDELREAIKKALDYQTLEQEKEVICDELKKNLHFGLIVGNCPRMAYVYNIIRQVAPLKTNILITGESGTGKELVAMAFHEQSPRKENPFVPINCGGIPVNLIESELFGYKKGAFTGALHDKKGLFEIANNGTLFLDEIGELGMPLQVKLLRAVQEKAFKPLGGTEEIYLDVRIISATNKRLEQEVVEGRFREDLFYRLNVIEIKLPALRERKADLKILAQHFLEKYAREAGKEITKISSYAIDLLNKYDFPGNIRELENLIERSVALSSTKILLPESLALSVRRNRWIEVIKGKRFDLNEVVNGVSLENILEDIESAYVRKALECSGNSKSKAAELLGINLRSIRYRIEKLSINKQTV